MVVEGGMKMSMVVGSADRSMVVDRGVGMVRRGMGGGIELRDACHVKC